jgi:uncharacterized protein (TIGR04255 family)
LGSDRVLAGPHERRSLPSKEREIYPNAPLQFVAFEMRMPYAPHLATLEGSTGFYDALRDLVPIIRTAGNPGVEVAAGPFSLSASAGPTRMLDRGRTLSVTISPTAVVVETSLYSQFDEFVKILERVVRAVGAAAEIAGVQRVGLRYIDEIRVDGVTRTADWEGYIAQSLLSAVHLDDRFEPSTIQSLVEFDLGGGQKTVMRFGALSGYIVDPAGPLRLKRTGDGPYFLIDLDSFWIGSEDELPEFTPESVLERCASLRDPVWTLFEASITEKLRNEVLRKEVKDG